MQGDRPANPLDDPEPDNYHDQPATGDEEPREDCPPDAWQGIQDNAGISRRPAAVVRMRLIQANRKARADNAKRLRLMQHSVVQMQAFRTVAIEPFVDKQNFGQGHVAFALGPIVFCKRCGGD